MTTILAGPPAGASDSRVGTNGKRGKDGKRGKPGKHGKRGKPGKDRRPFWGEKRQNPAKGSSRWPSRFCVLGRPILRPDRQNAA